MCVVDSLRGAMDRTKRRRADEAGWRPDEFASEPANERTVVCAVRVGVGGDGGGRSRLRHQGDMTETDVCAAHQ